MLYPTVTMRMLAAASTVYLTLFNVAAQSPAPPTQPISDEVESSQLLHWREVLDQLSIEARTLQDQNARPDAVIAVADAYWNLDRKIGSGLFRSALDLALAIDSRKDRDSSVRRVIASAARRDIKLARDLMNQLQVKQDSDSSAQASAASIDLLEVDKTAAEAVALADSQRGPSFDAAWLIFELHKQDPVAAARVYAAYLNNVNWAKPSELLWLGGYPFGFHEALGGSMDPVQFRGVFGLSNSGLTPNPALAQAFLTVASEMVDRTLQQAQAMPPPQAEALRALAFFTLTYLWPQIERYRPDLTSHWLALQQSTGANLDTIRREELLSKVMAISAARDRAAGQADPVNLSAEELLTQAEKLPTACQRDAVYSRVALESSHGVDFKKAIARAEKISDLNLKVDVLQFVYFDMSRAAMSAKTTTSVEEALQFAKRITSPEQRGLLYLQIAELYAANRDRDHAHALLIELSESCDRIDAPGVRAALLLAAAYDLTDLDSTSTQAFPMMKKAIHLLNENREVRIDRISALRKIDLSCDKKNPEWYGASEPVGRFNIIDTFLKIAEVEPEIAEQLARDLSEGSNRVRALSALAGAGIRAAKASAKTRALRQKS